MELAGCFVQVVVQMFAKIEVLPGKGEEEKIVGSLFWTSYWCLAIVESRKELSKAIGGGSSLSTRERAGPAVQ
jgi:hypothetical protein